MPSAYRNAQSGQHSSVLPHSPQYFAGYRSGRVAWSTYPESKPDPSMFDVVSPRGLFRIGGYRTLEGSVGMLITIVLAFVPRATDTTYLRLVLGRRALTTTIRHISSKSGSAWELEARAPPSDDSACPSTPIPLSVQALSSNNAILDSVIVGSFCYTNRSHLTPEPILTQPLNLRTFGFQDLPHSINALKPQPRTSSPHTFSPRTSSPRPLTARSQGAKASKFRQRKKRALMRTRRLSPGRDLPESHKVTLEFTTPVETMCMSWGKEEMKIGRRLVKFVSEMEDFQMKISCECISLEEYSDSDTVISCIYRRDTGDCYVTSVDIICLLENLVGESFEIEEKNRIRRNLEGFRPKTVSKSRGGWEEFFQQIMEFPSPKPRNIEKDVKVFDWNVLPQALDKIISKYSLYDRLSDSSESSPSLQPCGIPSPHPTEALPILAPSFSPGYLERTSQSPFFYDLDSYISRAFTHRAYLPDAHLAPFASRSNTYTSSSGTSPLSVSSSPRSISPFGESPQDMQLFRPDITRTRNLNSLRHPSLDRSCTSLDTFDHDDFSPFDAFESQSPLHDQGLHYV